MTTLSFQLFGGFHFRRDGVPMEGVHQRMRLLLTYLLLHRHTPQQRQHLAFLFWPDSTEPQARTNLRKQLHHLRHILPDIDRFLRDDKQSLQWRSDASLHLDVAEFEEALEKVKRARQVGDQSAVLNPLQRAVKLYQGDLLPDCYEDWIKEERERLRQAFVEALEQLVHLLESQRRYQEAISFAKQLQRCDPLHEEHCRWLMRLYALSSNRSGALRLYHEFAAKLRHELGAEPSPATRQMYQCLLE